MSTNGLEASRRAFLLASTAAAAAPGFAFAAPTPKYTRYNVTSPEGQKMLVSYAKGIEAMLKLPPTDPRNWFRNAFIHFMDCPHGNWWFYVWHRGFIGFFEQNIRELSGDPTFALPYWDWTELPQIPDAMFDGPLDPTSRYFEPYTKNLQVFTELMKPPLTQYWSTLNPDQRAQLNQRGYTSFDLLWNDVTGYSPSAQAGISGNEAFATTCAARYLSRSNPKLSKEVAYDCSLPIIECGLSPVDYYNPDNTKSFTSSKTASHTVQPGSTTKFSVLEGFPHNNVHNYIGGVGPLDPGPYGNMTNFLSPVDPIFFLHHANMDRLWDLWTRKQQALHLSILPPPADVPTFMNEPFRFFVNGKGQYVTNAKAADFFSTAPFDYGYQPAKDEALAGRPAPAHAMGAPIKALVSAKGVATLALPAPAKAALAAAAPTNPCLVAEVTLGRPTGLSTSRAFDVLVGAPADAAGGADSPYYAGTIALFGPSMAGMKMSTDVSFAVPLPRKLKALQPKGLAATGPVTIRLVPSAGATGPAPALKAVTVRF